MHVFGVNLNSTLATFEEGGYGEDCLNMSRRTNGVHPCGDAAQE
jgi:hypothetical protein